MLPKENVIISNSVQVNTQVKMLFKRLYRVSTVDHDLPIFVTSRKKDLTFAATTLGAKLSQTFV